MKKGVSARKSNPVLDRSDALPVGVTPSLVTDQAACFATSLSTAQVRRGSNRFLEEKP